MVVRSQIIDLFLVDRRPEVRANELHGVQFVLEAWHFAGETLDDPIAGAVANVFESGQVILLEEKYMV
jgi:hypothetical protein